MCAFLSYIDCLLFVVILIAQQGESESDTSSSSSSEGRKKKKRDLTAEQAQAAIYEERDEYHKDLATDMESGKPYFSCTIITCMSYPIIPELRKIGQTWA